MRDGVTATAMDKRQKEHLDLERQNDGKIELKDLLISNSCSEIWSVWESPRSDGFARHFV